MAQSTHHTELTDMRGIGPARATRIQQALKINFAEELLRFSPEEIHQKLAATGPKIPRLEIQQWLIQALRLVKAEEAQATAAPNAMASIISAMDTPAVDEAIDFSGPGHFPAVPSSSEGLFHIAWVEGGLHITHRGNQAEPVQLTTADPRTLYEWLTEQLNPPNLAMEQSPSAKTAAVTAPQIEVTTITAISLDIDRVGSTAQPQVAKGVPFVVRAGVRVRGEAAAVPAKLPVALAQFSVRNRLTKEQIALGTAQTALQGEAITTLQSPPVTLTIPGIYQLQAIVTLPGQEAQAAYRELQLIKVL